MSINNCRTPYFSKFIATNTKKEKSIKKNTQLVFTPRVKQKPLTPIFRDEIYDSDLRIVYDGTKKDE